MAYDRLNYYEILQVSPHAAPEVIKAAHRALSKTMHPDTGGSTALAVAINEAVDVLLDPAKRQRYDMELRIGKAKTFASGTSERIVDREVCFVVCVACGVKNRLKDASLSGIKCTGCGCLFSDSGTPRPLQQKTPSPTKYWVALAILGFAVGCILFMGMKKSAAEAYERAVVSESRTGIVTAINEGALNSLEIFFEDDLGKKRRVFVSYLLSNEFRRRQGLRVGDRVFITAKSNTSYYVSGGEYYVHSYQLESLNEIFKIVSPF